MKNFRRFITTVAFALVICMFISSEPFQMVSAVTGQDLVASKQYLKEVKMFYGRTKEAAKTACEKEGFVFCPTDLNKGAPNVIREGDYTTKPNAAMGIYMGYKTTEDKGNAITDITLLDMKHTHFEKVDYQEFLDNHIEDFRNEAAQMMVLVNELKRQKEAGSPNALMSFDLLNLFYVDDTKAHDAEDNKLGNYLINKADITFFEKFIQRGNTMVLGRITDLLCGASSDYNQDGTTWVDRAKVSDAAIQYSNATSATKNMYDEQCQDPAKRFVKCIRDFSTTYKEAKKRFDKYGETLGYSQLKGATEENGVEKLSKAGEDCRFPEYIDALKTYALLDSYPYAKAGEKVVNNAAMLNDEGSKDSKNTVTTYSKDISLADYIMDLANDKTLDDHLSTVYPIIESMTSAQRVTLTLGGFGVLVEGLYQSKDYVANRNEAINKAMQKLKSIGSADGRVYIWSGMDKSLFNKKVVETNAAKEAKSSGVDYDNSLNEAARKEQNNLQSILNVVDLCTIGYSGVVTIASAILGNTLWKIGTNIITTAAIKLAEGLIGTGGLFASYALGGVLCALQVLNIIAMVVGLVLLIYNILQWTGVFNQKEPIDYTEIPDAVMDVRQRTEGTFSVRYDSVKSNATKEVLLGDENEVGSFGARLKSGTINVQDISTDYAELTAYQGILDRWMAMYYSTAPAAGDPIEVVSGKEPFITQDNYRSPDGYRPLSLIIGTTAANVNDIEVFEEKGSPLYVFFPGKSVGLASGEIIKDTGTYITKVRLSYAEKKEDAINLLKKGEYEYFDTNLTPYKGYTYLGYQRGGIKSALRDIRIANSGANTIVFGGANYGRMGQDGKDSTPDGLALYATAKPFAGSPIVSLSIQNRRLESGNGMEPVCLFSGGNAVDIGQMWKDNICTTPIEDTYQFFSGRAFNTYNVSSKSYSHEFMSEDDPSNGLYLYFQPKEQFKSADKDGKPAQRYIGGFSYFLAGDKSTTDNRFGSNYTFMQNFAKENGFELLKDGDSPVRMMSDLAGEMTMATTWRDVGGYPADTYNFDQVHTIYGNAVFADGDGGMTHGFGFSQRGDIVYSRLTREKEKMIYHTAMYFGVSYTYNPYRAITGLTGLTTLYTETSKQIKYTGLSTPAGTFQACNVSVQGSPMMSPGISVGYYSPNTMYFPLYTNYEAKQKSNLSWMTKKETEILSRYLLTSGPRDGISPLKENDIKFSTQEKPGNISGYVPLCDLRTPGDYEHPMNFALDTTNKGSKYLYIYLAKNAGGRPVEREEIKEEDGTITQTHKDISVNNEYTAKTYVAAVFCGVGRNPDEAIAKLYENASGQWQALAQGHDDIPANPMVTEFDEIIPIDLSSEHEWYKLHFNDTNVSKLKNGDWVRGNEMAYYRWEGHKTIECLRDQKTPDDYERDFKCAYMGVVRTNIKSEAAYGMVKYYTDAKTAPTTLNCGSTKCALAGGPVDSPEGKYFLYYSTNSGTASYNAPITRLEVSDDIFINGYNTSFTVSESDRTDNKLPQYGQLRMRTDEHKYIHLGYDRAELPYYEQLYLGVGKTKAEAFTDMIGTTNAFAAMDVNCNYNSQSNQWIAIGYRRTNVLKNAIRDVFLYQGDNPPDVINIKGGYMENVIEEEEEKEKILTDEDLNLDIDLDDEYLNIDLDDSNEDTDTEENTEEQTEEPAEEKPLYIPYREEDSDEEGVPYRLVKHNLKSGSEIVSLNKGNGGTKGLYLYYTKAPFYRDMSVESEVTPITNICFTYGDISPRYATAEDLASVFERSYYAKLKCDVTLYKNPIWECVLGVEGSPTKWNPTGEGATRFSLNRGVRPGMGGNSWNNPADPRVYMYVDRSDSDSEKVYQIRENGRLPEYGYYSPTSTFGYIKQVQ